MKENTKEIISYVFVGIMTTLVNLYCLFCFIDDPLSLVSR